jgi:long-chain acyl-CoA synthetase
MPASVGVALPGIEIKMTDDGELLTRSPSVMLGYWNNAEATANVIDTHGWLHTGDRVSIENDHIYITGRLKEIIVLANGEKLPPTDMEMCIELDSLFDHALVIGEGRPYLSALLVLNPGVCEQLAIDPDDTSEQFETTLIKRISGLLDSFPGYAKIRRVACIREPWTVDNGLLTPTLKVRRSRIMRQYSEVVEALYAGH